MYLVPTKLVSTTPQPNQNKSISQVCHLVVMSTTPQIQQNKTISEVEHVQFECTHHPEKLLEGNLGCAKANHKFK